jgi:hypothetical protein
MTHRLLTTDNVIKIAGPGTIMLTYDKFKQISSLDNLFRNGVKNVIILYRKSKFIGHWVGLLKRGHIVEYFDSYGYDIDKPLYWNGFDKDLGQDGTWLTKLLYEYMSENPKNKVVFNEHKYQGLHEKDSATCGRHVALRIRNRDLSLEQYQKYFNQMKRQHIDPDQYVVAATDIYLD